MQSPPIGPHAVRTFGIHPPVGGPSKIHEVGFVDLFSGAGGFTWGFVQAGFSPLLAVDSDVSAIRTHELNFSPYKCTSLNRNLEKFHARAVASVLGARTKQSKILVGGPPCQGWSQVGRGKIRSLPDRAKDLLADPRNHLYKRFLAIATHLQPKCVVMENVPGMLSVEGRNIADEVKENLHRIGYISDYVQADAAWFGVPQYRQRLIFIGFRKDLNVPVELSQLKAWTDSFRSKLGLPDQVTVSDAIGDLPPIRNGSTEDPVLYPKKVTFTAYRKLMRIGCDGLVTDHVSRNNPQDKEAFRIMKQGGWYRDLPAHLKRYRDDIFEDKYKRLYKHRRSWTVTAHLEKDCYTHIHPGQPRTISIREAARLQSFPDSFRFFGNWGDRFRQIGNAVPPLMAWGIAEFVKSRLRGTFRM